MDISKPTSADMEFFNALAKDITEHRLNQLGYPFDQTPRLVQFYSWLAETGLADITLINVGDPYKKDWDMLNTDACERFCIDFIAEHCGFCGEHWGVLANGGSDGNMHGIYFGRKYLKSKCPDLEPILYVSEEAHYSLKKIGDIQNIETRMINAFEMGEMDTEDLRKKIDPTRPAIIAIAIGGTFKGAIDDQKKIGKVLEEIAPVAVYRHLDAALFGGYLPFLDDKLANEILNQSAMGFDSVAISGHKFLALNEPAGIFICKREHLDCVNENPVPYLNGVIPTLNCSRSGFDPLKLCWLLKTEGVQGLQKQAERSLEMAKLLQAELISRGVKAWRNEMSNTVFFPRPKLEVVKKYALACGEDKFFGKLSHIVAMQYFDSDFTKQIAKEIAEAQEI